MLITPIKFPLQQVNRTAGKIIVDDDDMPRERFPGMEERIFMFLVLADSSKLLAEDKSYLEETLVEHITERTTSSDVVICLPDNAEKFLNAMQEIPTISNYLDDRERLPCLLIVEGPLGNFSNREKRFGIVSFRDFLTPSDSLKRSNLVKSMNSIIDFISDKKKERIFDFIDNEGISKVDVNWLERIELSLAFPFISMKPVSLDSIVGARRYSISPKRIPARAP
jgi:hypothetical protein